MGQMAQANPELVNGVLQIDTTVNWMRNDTPPGIGIICIEYSSTGPRYKVGNGVDLYRNLVEPKSFDNPLDTYKTTLIANTISVTLPFEYDSTNPNILVFLNNIKQEQTSIIYTYSTHITLTESSPIDLPIEIIKIPKSTMYPITKKNYNYVVDGNFNFWLEGDTQTTNGYGSATMWHQSVDALGSTMTHSKGTFLPGELFPDGTPCPKYYSRNTFNGVSTAESFVARLQQIEDVKRLAGRNVTLRFYARSIDGPKKIGTELLQSFGTGGTPTGWVSGFHNKAFTIGEQWTEITTTVFIPSVVGKTFGTNDDSSLMLLFWFSALGNTGTRSGGVGQQSGIIDIAKVSVVEGGNHVTPLERSVQEEEDLVNRYYQVLADGAETLSARIAHGVIDSTTAGSMMLRLRIPMSKKDPTITVVNAGYFSLTSAGSGFACTSIIGNAAGTNAKVGIFTIIAYTSGLTFGQACCLYVSTVGGKIALDCRL